MVTALIAAALICTAPASPGTPAAIADLEMLAHGGPGLSTIAPVQYKPAPRIRPKFNNAARGLPPPKPPGAGKKTPAKGFGSNPKPKALTKKFNDAAGGDDGNNGGGGGNNGGGGGGDGGGNGAPPTNKRNGPTFKPPGT